jgi:16S rRNA (cytosine1402-N4)-methyltransferase
LNIQPNGLYVDVTFGGGGHSRAILDALQSVHGVSDVQNFRGGKLYSFDQDLDAYRNALEGAKAEVFNNNEHWQFVHSNFRYLRNFMDYYGVEQIDGLLGDLGVSFHHFDSPERGFSFRFSAPLDMRMNQTGGKTAAEILNTYDEEDLARILYMYGEMNNSRQIAKKIVKVRSQKSLERTEDFVEVLIGRPVGVSNGELDVPAGAKKDLAKAFQALRIEVNDEMGALREMLLAAKDLLKPGGRIAILTYHSLEDRMVKNFLRSGNLDGKIEKDFYGNILSPFKVLEKGLTASAEEVESNPRARSAKLRVAEKI